MITFFERFDKFMKFKGLNDNKISIETGISNGLIGKGRVRGAISQDNISKILNTYPELNANWLLTGRGSMLINGDLIGEVVNIDQVHDVQTKYESQSTIDINHEQVVKQLEEERELLKQSHKEIGILEFRLNSTTTELEKAMKEIERLKKMVENVVERKLINK